MYTTEDKRSLTLTGYLYYLAGFRLAMLLLVLTSATGCVAKLGAVSPSATRTNEAFSWGTELMIPIKMTELDWGIGVTLPYEQHTSLRQSGAGLLEGTLTTRSVAAECRLAFVTWQQSGGEERKLVWIAAGPEYTSNTFRPDSSAVTASALRGVIYDESMRDSLGWKVSAGYAYCPFVFALRIELSYHWAHTSTTIEGLSNGVPFRRTKPYELEWISVFVGIGIAY